MGMWNRNFFIAFLFGTVFFTSSVAHAQKFNIVSGLRGVQDTKSKELTVLSPVEAKQVAVDDLLSILQPTGAFILDNSRNVTGMIFITEPYETVYRYVCRRDHVTLRYQSKARYDEDGAWLDRERQPVGVEGQPVFHIEQLPVPGITSRKPGASYRYKSTICDANHPGPAAAWFAAPSATDAARAANMFRIATDEIKAKRLTPTSCDSARGEACSQLILSLNDPSKLRSVEPCAPSWGDDACYVLSFGDIEVTITGIVPRNSSEPITPTVIESIRADTVITVSL